MYDKYANVEVSLASTASEWKLPVQGYNQTLQFAEGADGALQRKLVILTQEDMSPSSVYKFTRSLLMGWSLHKQLLAGGPMAVKRLWREHVKDIDTAKSAKSVLKAASKVSVGPWRAEHLPLVRGLDTRANSTLVEQHGKVARREHLLSVDIQAALTRVLDERAADTRLSEPEAEGLTALALMFQRGVRPVQLLSLRTEHVDVVVDASGELACLVSFHEAKKLGDVQLEMPAQVKPEWAPALAKLHGYAIAADRVRLFESKTREGLWRRVQAVCASLGVSVAFGANDLRHTAAQSLADSGHSRFSIRRFLGHANNNAAATYIRASRQQGELINRALGASRLYKQILSLAEGRFVSVAQLRQASEDKQIGAVVGHRLVAGVGLCSTGQSSCRYDPVTSCYGCSKFMPSLDRASHEEAIAGMRDQVLDYLSDATASSSAAYMQLTRALSGAQQAIAMIDRLAGEPSE